MATPTAGKHPSSAVATPPVSTPFSASNHPSHPAFSPHGPRSVVPSPQQVKKSPANNSTVFGYPGATQSGFQGYDSPSAAMALGGMDLGIEGLGGTPSASGLGAIGAIGGARGDEDERRRKLASVIDILKVNNGRLSEAGIERLARKVGLESLWETHMASGGSTRTLIIAGSALALDIDFANNVVKKVSLSFPEAPDIVTKHTGKAEKILTQDLEFQGNENPLTKKLDRFAENLESLAVLDKLSVIPGLNCYEALAGIYESLERVHMWEVERLKESEDMAGKSESYLAAMAMCTKSGKPAMHTRDRLGLRLDYWKSKRRLEDSGKGKIWSLMLGCTPLPPLGMYTPIRVSTNWISSEVKTASQPAEDLMAALEGGPTLDWREPENTILPPLEPSKVEGLDTGHRFPEVMFLAKFDPPLVVPYNLAQSLSAVESTQSATYDSLMFPPEPSEKGGATTRRISRQRLVRAYSSVGEQSDRVHTMELIMNKTDWASKLTEIPFSHPRQFVEMLPFLRQYAFVTTLLGNVFGHGSKSESVAEDTKIKSRRAEFDDFMAVDPPTENTFRVDVIFRMQPEPQFQVNFPFRDRSASVVFAIKAHGAVEVITQNILKDEGALAEKKHKGKSLVAADLSRMLEITEDIGVLIEYMKRRLE